MSPTRKWVPNDRPVIPNIIGANPLGAKTKPIMTAMVNKNIASNVFNETVAS